MNNLSLEYCGLHELDSQALEMVEGGHPLILLAVALIEGVSAGLAIGDAIWG